MSAATVPEAAVANQPAPTVSPSEAEAAQLAVAASTTSTPASALAPITSMLATAAVGLFTPEAASRNLWDSWQDKDRERAVLYASVAAVNVLFATPWTPETLDQGCHPSGSDGVAATCLFVQGTSAKVLHITGSQDTGYKVDRVTLARQNLPQVSILPNVTTDPNGPGNVPVGPVIDQNGNLIDPGSDPAGPATVPTVSSSGSSAGGTKKPRTTTKPKTATTRAKPRTTQAPAADIAPVEAPAPVEPPANTGVPAGAPVVNEVEG